LLVSDIDVVVIGPLPQGNGPLFALAKHLKQRKIALNVDVIDRARVSITNISISVASLAVRF
jgi:DNA polymerase sigma